MNFKDDKKIESNLDIEKLYIKKGLNLLAHTEIINIFAKNRKKIVLDNENELLIDYYTRKYNGILY